MDLLEGDNRRDNSWNVNNHNHLSNGHNHDEQALDGFSNGKCIELIPNPGFWEVSNIRTPRTSGSTLAI